MIRSNLQIICTSQEAKHLLNVIVDAIGSAEGTVCIHLPLAMLSNGAACIDKC